MLECVLTWTNYSALFTHDSIEVLSLMAYFVENWKKLYRYFFML